jgi:integrase
MVPGQSARSMREARRVLRQLLEEVEAGRPPAPARPDETVALGDVVSHYLAAKRRTWSSTTLDAARSFERALPAGLAARPAHLVTTAEVQAFLDVAVASGLKPASVVKRRQLIVGALDHAVAKGWVRRNVARETHTTAAGPVRGKVSADPDQVRKVLADVDGQLGVCLRLAALSAARRGELCGLRWSDLDGATLTIERAVKHSGDLIVEGPTKTHQARRLVLPASIVAELKRQHRAARARAAAESVILAADAWVFSHDPASRYPWRPQYLTLAWRRIAAKAGLEVRLHDLRHLHASVLLANGVPATAVAARLGHANVRTTLSVYAQALPAGDAAAAEIAGQLLG